MIPNEDFNGNIGDESVYITNLVYLSYLKMT